MEIGIQSVAYMRYGENRYKALKEIGFTGVMSLESKPSEKLGDEAHRAMNKALAMIAKQLTE